MPPAYHAQSTHYSQPSHASAKQMQHILISIMHATVTRLMFFKQMAHVYHAQQAPLTAYKFVYALQIQYIQIQITHANAKPIMSCK